MTRLILTILTFSLSITALASGSSSGGGGGGGGAAATGAVQRNEAGSDKIKTAREELRERIQKKKRERALAFSNPVAFDSSHQLWNEILKSTVVYNSKRTASAIDYRNVNRKKLKKYLEPISKISKDQIERLPQSDQLAFYINAYNALTVERILQHKPIVKSIKELGSGFPFFSSPWKVKFFTLFGEKTYLDKIEHEYVRESGKYNDPRIHFAFNCASIGCPALLDQAFVGSKLNKQLDFAMNKFLKDRTRNRFERKSKTLFVSQIFDWYKSDFEQGHKGFTSLKQTLMSKAKYLADNPEDLKAIKRGQFKIDFLKYDWTLNDHKLGQKLM